MNPETLERFVVQLLGIAQRCTDVASRRDLMRLANQLADLIEGREPSEETDQAH
jgi:hypothetical protein